MTELALQRSARRASQGGAATTMPYSSTTTDRTRTELIEMQRLCVRGAALEAEPRSQTVAL